MKARIIVVVFLILALLLAQFPNTTPVQAAAAVIYSDSLETGWADWSWAGVNFGAVTPVYSGSNSIAVTYCGWCGLFLHHSGLSTTGYSSLRFFMHGGSAGGQKLSLFAHLNDVEGVHISLPVPQANTWTEVRVPLSDLNAVGKTINGLTWQSSSAEDQPTLYIDEIALVDDSDPNGIGLDEAYLHPRSIPSDGRTWVVARARVSHPDGPGGIATVTLNASSLGLGSLTMHDNGLSNDGSANDDVYGTVFTVPSGVLRGEYTLSVKAVDKQGRTANLGLPVLVVLEPPGGSIPASLPQRLGWGRSWQDDVGQNWDYVYQYITYGWQGWGSNFVKRVVEDVWSKNDIPMITVYIMYGLPPACSEGGDCYYTKLQNASAVQDYLASLKEAAAEARGTRPVIFNLEPDFYGFMQQLSNRSDRPSGVRPDDPSSIPVALNISGYPNTLAGFGRRMVDLIRAEAPNAIVAPMASVWATNDDPGYVTTEAAITMGQRTGAFIRDMGGAEADLVIVEWSDRDSGSGVRPWWDDADHNLPRVNRALLWENAVSTTTGKRLILWQVPAGNMTLPNVCQQYKDNRAPYAFDHPRDLFDAGIIGVLFGAGDGCGTSLKTDGGYIVSRTVEAYNPPAVPTGLVVVHLNGNLARLRWNESSESDLWGYQVTYNLIGGGITTLDVSRVNSTSLLLPTEGIWQVRVAAYDAMGQKSQAAPPVLVSIQEDAKLYYLPLLRSR